MHTTKRWFVLIAMVLAISGGLLAQGTSTQTMMQKQQQTLEGGLGVTIVDGEVFYLFTMTPEFAIGKFGLGIDLNLRFNKQGKIRAGEYVHFGDFLRIIRYARWGLKGDPFYIRVGALDYARLGHGFIVYNYRNSASYDLRRTGIELDADFDEFGFESVYSDVTAGGLLGLRGYVRPVKFTEAANIPVIGGFEVGATYATDLDKNSGKTYGLVGSVPSTLLSKAVDNGRMAVYGFDAGLPLLNLSMLKSTLYGDYAKIKGFGNGAAAGIDLHFSGMGLLSIGAKYERRFLGDLFLPSFFDALYEHDRFMMLDTLNFRSKAAKELQEARKTEGYYGELLISILNTFNIVGGYQAPVGVRNQGVFHAELQTPAVIPQIVFGAGFDKRKIGPVFKLDENSILYSELGYKPIPYMIVSMLYQWTFAKQSDGSYVTQKRVEPKIRFVYSF
jgi:hypothetical protein